MLRKYVQKHSKSVSIKALAFAAFAPLLLNSQAQAEDNKIASAEKGTLTGAAAPSPTLGENSAYTLTETTESARSGNSIVLYELNQQTGKTNAKYYELGIKKTSYGSGDGESVYNVKLINDEIPISVKYSTDNMQPRLDNAGKNNPELDAIGTFKDLTGFNGGAINNQNGTMRDVNGAFIDNYGTNVGGAMEADGYMNSLTGILAGNHTSRSGGAIYASQASGAIIEEINADFIANWANNIGGAICAGARGEARMPLITGDFIGNYTVRMAGGALGSNTINIVNSNFIANASGDSGGAILYDGGSGAESIIGDFVANRVTDTSAYNYARGGAIYNSSKIASVVGDFVANHVEARGSIENSSWSQGGAISNQGGTITSIKGNFLGNYAQSLYATGDGMAKGGAIMNRSAGVITEIDGNFIGNYAVAGPGSAMSGAIHLQNPNTIVETLKGTFTGNYVQTDSGLAGGGAISLATSSVIDKIDSVNFEGNYVQSNSGNALGGAINNDSTINEILNSTFTGNYTKSGTGEAKGGAIYSTKDLNIVAENGTSIFEGNYTQKGEETDDNAIYLDSATATLKLEQKSDGKMYMYDNIRGADGYKTRIEGDGTGTYYMFNDIHNGDVTFANTMVNTVNNDIHVYNFKKLTVEQDTDFVADVDLANEEMDRFTADSYGEHQGNLNVVGMNMLSDTTKDDVAIYFAQEGLMNNVVNKIDEIPTTKWQTKAYTPIYKYNVDYIKKTDKFDETKQAGYFVFTKGDKILEDVIIDPEEHTVTPVVRPTHRPHEAFNPAVLSSNVVTQAGGNAAMNEALRFAFEHGDTFMNFSSMDRFAKANDNVYALSTDFNENLSYTDLSHENKSVWVKPYSVFEKIDLKNGPKVDTISYGTLVGFDSNIHRMKKGWYNVGTAYIGYNGSQIDYKGVDASMNGGLLGLTETFYKGNFWTAITATAGAGVAEAHTMYGKDDMTMLMAGIGSKTGYNFEFADGKFIIQPRMFISYSMINTFDYTNAAGVRIDSDPMHTIQLNPAIKFIGNTKNGWQPYASVGMMWNLLNETETTANGVKLPEMHTKPYVEYGVGIQKLWNDKYSAYGQAMVRNGGRTGVALTLGFRMALGNDGKPIERTQKDKQILKQVQNDNSKQILRSAQNDSKNNVSQNGGSNEILRFAQDDNKNNIAQNDSYNKITSLRHSEALAEESHDKQILKQVQNDNSKKILRSAQDDNKNNIVQNDSTKRKVLKQLSPTQKAHLMKTTRTSMLGIVK